MAKGRESKIERKTSETEVSLKLCLDGGKVTVKTGIGFLDHMLDLMASHGGFGLELNCKGDTWVDYHHSAEDVGIALGQAFREALGDMKGIYRYGDIILPMDEALMICAVDISGRGLLSMDAPFPTEKIGDFDVELIKEFFLAFVRKAEITLHFRELSGENSHHIAESMFKSFGRALAKAVKIDENRKKEIPSTKGVL